jgi:hypothetical protein
VTTDKKVRRRRATASTPAGLLLHRSLSLRTGGQRQVAGTAGDCGAVAVPVDALRRRNVMLSAD